MDVKILQVVGWTVFSFFCGSLPLSLWVGKVLGRKDIRSVGDGNPGAINAIKSGGWPIGVVALLLDISKAAAPVGAAYQLWHWENWEIIPIALAPLFGSAFSPFLKFKGGKSLAVSLGIWLGITLWKSPLVILSSLSIAFLIQANAGWAVVTAILANGAFFYLEGVQYELWIIFSIQIILLLYKHRNDLRQPPKLRSWLQRK